MSDKYKYQVSISTICAERYGGSIEIYDEMSTPDYEEWYDNEDDARADFDGIDAETLDVHAGKNLTTWKESRIHRWELDDNDGSSIACEEFDAKHADIVDKIIDNM